MSSLIIGLEICKKGYICLEIEQDQDKVPIYEAYGKKQLKNKKKKSL